MPIENLLTALPDQAGIDDFSFNHRKDHEEIRQAIQKIYGVNLPQYPIDPFSPNDMLRFLQYHQSYHNDMNSVLGLQSNDLSTADFANKEQRDSWIWLNWIEHTAAREKLAI